MFDQSEIIEFIDNRLGETRRLAMSLGVSEEINVQASSDQLERSTKAINDVVTFIQYHAENPLNPVVLKNIANAWSYHEDFNPAWLIAE